MRVHTENEGKQRKKTRSKGGNERRYGKGGDGEDGGKEKINKGEYVRLPLATHRRFYCKSGILTLNHTN